MVPEKETVPPIALRTLRKLGEEARLHELIERGYEEAAFERHGRTLSVEPICTCRPHHGAGGFISVSRLRLYEPDDRGAGERRPRRSARCSSSESARPYKQCPTTPPHSRTATPSTRSIRSRSGPTRLTT